MSRRLLAGVIRRMTDIRRKAPVGFSALLMPQYLDRVHPHGAAGKPT